MFQARGQWRRGDAIGVALTGAPGMGRGYRSAGNANGLAVAGSQ